MSEKSSKVLVTPHNQAFAKGEVLKINGLYWRVLGAQDDKPYAKLLLLGAKSKESLFIPGANIYRSPNAFETDFSYTDPATGNHMVGAYVPYYSKDMSPKDTSQQSADSSCVKWASEQEFSNYLDTVGCPVHTVYRVVDNIVGSQNPALVVKDTATSTYDYIVPVGISRQTGILRKCRLLSVVDIIQYFGRNEITDKELYEDLLGGKHYNDPSALMWHVNAGGALYDAIKYSYNPNQDGEGEDGLNLTYAIDNRTKFSEGGVISSTRGGALLVINLNLREYRNWEKATDW